MFRKSGDIRISIGVRTLIRRGQITSVEGRRLRRDSIGGNDVSRKLLSRSRVDHRLAERREIARTLGNRHRGISQGAGAAALLGALIARKEKKLIAKNGSTHGSAKLVPLEGRPNLGEIWRGVQTGIAE